MVGEYRVVDFLGAGGMGEVYRAEHSKIGRVAAVKVLSQATNSGGFVERFFNEARIQASLQHPNIATLYDFLEVGGQPCIIMEYVDGQSLSERIQSYGQLPLSETIFIFQAVVEAIDYIHRHGIIHRDIKSNNIKISSSGQVKLLDFGIAKGQMSPGLTEVGSVIGTLMYLSPEHLKGGTSDARGDIWALGVLLYEMVTGRMPFESETLGDLCEKIDKAAYIPPVQLDSGVPYEVANIIARCLKRNPLERYQTADDLLRDGRKLSALVSSSHLTGEVKQTSPARVLSTLTRSKTILLAAGGGAALVVMLFIVGTFMVMSPSPESNTNNNTVAMGLDSSPSPKTAPSGNASGTEKSIEVSLTEGRADVYRDGQPIGTTPFMLNAHVGDQIKLTLKREGYQDEPVDFTVTESKHAYAFRMTK
jgi:serine/threonine-protein kinase